MIDIGLNLSNEKFNNPEKSLLDAKQVGMDAVILTTTSEGGFLKNLELQAKHSHIFPIFITLGLHPHNASQHKAFFNNFEKFFSMPHRAQPGIVAIGEFGLDYNRMFSPKEDQIESVHLHFQKAVEKSLPCFLHERDAHEDFVALMKEYPKTEKVVHCFTGKKEQVKKYLDLDAYIGITGWLSDEKRGGDLREALKYIPLDRLMIETDAPYLTPKNMPRKASINQPAYLKYVLDNIVELRPESLETIAYQVRKNTIMFFGLPMYH